jgi:hypothetical protein
MMDDSDIDALAKGMVPFVRDCIAKATAVPPELAEQVANAVRMLHESPDITRSETRPPKVTRIERDGDGNFVPVYDDQPV